MKAVVRRQYGSSAVLRIEDVAVPAVAAGQVLVRVVAASINPYDWHSLRGEPYLVRLGAGWRAPKGHGLGVDLAGRVEAIGPGVSTFAVGDEVFGQSVNTLAEYVAVSAAGLVAKPAGLSYTCAAGLPLAGLTALQGIRDRGKVQPGQTVLINGASGGVGSFAVQIAKAFGAQVTGVCGTDNVELVRTIGADQVIDYRQADFADGRHRHDLVVDAVGNRKLAELRRSLKPSGTLVLIGAADGRWIGPIMRPLAAAVVSRASRQRLVPMLTSRRQEDLVTLVGLVESGSVRTVVDRRYPLAEIADAVDYLEAGHVRGKIVITI